MREIRDRLMWARKRASYDSPTTAAQSRGWTVSTYLGHENGDRNPSRNAAIKYARAFGVRWEWLLEGEGQALLSGQDINIVGYVGAGDEIYPVDDHELGAGIDDASMPPSAPESTVAVRVRGNSMYPRYFDGEDIYYDNTDQPPRELVGRECILELANGRMLVKVIRTGTKKSLFDLESWNAPLMENEEIKWAAPITWVKRK